MLAKHAVVAVGRCIPCLRQVQLRRLSSSYYVLLKCQPICGTAQDQQNNRLRSGGVPLHQQVRFAGHSQWANRRHIKGAMDAQKAKIAQRMTNNIRIAIKEGGSIDPKLNSMLRRYLEQAKAADIPKTTLENCIKQAEKTKDAGQVITMEARGPGNSFMVFEAFTNNVIHTRNNAKAAFKKCGVKTQQDGTVQYLFDRKGVFRIALDENCPSDEDSVTELALEIGAEDFKKVTEEDGVELMEFICDMPDFAEVKKNMQEKNLTITQAQLEYIPKSTVELEGPMLEYINALYDKLEENCDVVRIFDNIAVKAKS